MGVVIAQEITKAYHQAYKVDQRGKESFLIFCSQQDYLLEISGV
ncbi:MAG: hypothetical protein Q8O99_07160 [bacterium]|nr:hypothetical protein [bacterium]